MKRAFFAYAAAPTRVVGTIRKGLETAKRSVGNNFQSWEEDERCGSFISTNVRAQIDQARYLIADVTTPNFNVIFEIGYALGRGLPVRLVRNKTEDVPEEHLYGVGLFRNFFVDPYDNGEQLAETLERFDKATLAPTPFVTSVDTRQPLFTLYPRSKTDFVTHCIACLRINKARFRAHDLFDDGELTAEDAIRQIARSTGLMAVLQPKGIVGSFESNVRTAFVAGLACGLKKQLIILQEPGGPVPLDFSDFAVSYTDDERIAEEIRAFCEGADQVLRAYGRTLEIGTAPGKSVMERLMDYFGQLSAENESEYLSRLYIRTDEFERARLFDGRFVVGRKGMGKTALFHVMNERLREQEKRSTILVEFAPEAHQMQRFKDALTSITSGGNKARLAQLFWEYVILMEAARSLVHSERNRPLHAMSCPELIESLEGLLDKEFVDARGLEADFAERLMEIIDKVHHSISLFPDNEREMNLKAVALLRSGSVDAVKTALGDYCLETGHKFRVLVDNVDKGFNVNGLDSVDIEMVRGLISASSSLRNNFKRSKADLAVLSFVRDDVYSQLIDNVGDRGKDGVIRLEWNNEAHFETMMLRRLEMAGLVKGAGFEPSWDMIAVRFVKSVPSWQFVLQRSMRRPRFCIYLLRSCMAAAFRNGGRERISEDDFLEGEREYSNYVVQEISNELRDVARVKTNVLRKFARYRRRIIKQDEVQAILRQAVDESPGSVTVEELVDKLMWFGFLGIREARNDRYIWDFRYDLELMRVLLHGKDGSPTSFCVNRAFCPQLGLEDDV